MMSVFRSPILLGATLALLGALVVAPSVPAQPDNPLARSGSMIGSTQMSGRATGRLVCLQCEMDDRGAYGVDCVRSTDDTEDCQGEGKRRALEIEGRKRVFPILPGNDKVRDEIVASSMHGERVTVTGRYYPSVGAIFASSVLPAD